MANCKDRLRSELQGEEGSFILELRNNLKWDHSKLMSALNTFYEFILSMGKTEVLDRDIAYGFWFFANFVRKWSENQGFRAANNYSEHYYNQAYEVIYFLVEWYFGPECPLMSHEDFLEEFKLLDEYLKK